MKKKIDDVRNGRMESIMKLAERKAEKICKVEEFKHRMQSEESQRIKDKLELHELKLARSTQRYRECMTLRAETVRHRNVSNNEKLSSFRTQEFDKMQQTLDSARDRSD